MGRTPKPRSKWRDFGSGTVFTRGTSTPRKNVRGAFNKPARSCTADSHTEEKGGEL
jgi:hypothetical protein